MKLLLVFIVVLFAVWLWRSGRQQARPPAGRSDGPDPRRAIEMVRCELCGVHCPRLDALAGKRGVYCTAQHRSQAEP